MKEIQPSVVLPSWFTVDELHQDVNVFSLTFCLCTYSSVRKLVKLSAVQFMLNNHTVSISLNWFRIRQEHCCIRVEPSHSACLRCVLWRFLSQSEHFSFLGVNNQSNLSDMRCRTTFYTALGRLLMVDLGKRQCRHSCGFIEFKLVSAGSVLTAWCVQVRTRTSLNSSCYL